MKIGVCAIGYQCGEHLADVLQPWLELKASGEHKVLMSAAYGVFPEMHALLKEHAEAADESLPLLRQYYSKGDLDALYVASRPLYEWDLRTCTLPFLLKRGIDVLWLLDLQDEIYRVEEILRITRFIEQHQEMVWFRVTFKNYAFDSDSYIDEFAPPRVWRAKIPALIRSFHYDNCITYEDGQKQDTLPRCRIPKEMAFPRHLSWVGNAEYLKRKIRYQLLHFGTCSYRWNEEKDCLEFNEEFYLRAGKKVPHVYRASDVVEPQETIML